jgi:hypothetical protein
MNKVAVAAVALLLLGGCSLVSIDSKTRYSDASGYFDAKLLDQIKPDETSGVWLRQHFGDPLFVDRGFMNPMVPAEQVQIETWRFMQHRQSNTSVFLLFRARSRYEESEYLHAVLANDLVVTAWRDTLESVDTPRVMGSLGYAPVASEPVTSMAAAAPAADSQAGAPVEDKAAAVSQEAVSEVKPGAEENAKQDSTPEPAPTSVPSLGPANLGYSP